MAEKDYDLGEVLKGNIDGVTSKFADFSDDHLTQLRTLESGADGAKRATLLAAIEAEQKGRAAEAEAAAEAKAAAEAPAKSAKPETGDAAAVRAALDKTGARATPAEKAAGKRTAAAKPARGKTGAKVGFGAAKTNPIAGEANTVVFTDADGNLLADIPPLEFGTADFVPAAAGPKGAVELQKRIDFDTNGPRAIVAAAWLVDDSGKGALVTRFIAPLIVGGGRSAEIPKASLKFVPETDDEKAARTKKAA